jgi:hypothetical protein
LKWFRHGNESAVVVLSIGDKQFALKLELNVERTSFLLLSFWVCHDDLSANVGKHLESILTNPDSMMKLLKIFDPRRHPHLNCHYSE